MVQSVLALPEHLDVFENGIAAKLDFSFSGPQGARLAQLVSGGKIARVGQAASGRNDTAARQAFARRDIAERARLGAGRMNARPRSVNGTSIACWPAGAAAEVPRVGRAAVAALYDDLSLEPKPGLVSFRDSGSHDDMDARTFMRSLFALRHSFARLAALGASDAHFSALEHSGIEAETRMLRATAGINTHRGAIFCLGLLCASAGNLIARGAALQATAMRRTLIDRWAESLTQRAAQRASQTRPSNGAAVVRRLGLNGASAEAARGFPVLFETTLPALRAATARGAAPRQARVDALFHTIAVLDDTNLAHRGGLAGLRFAQRAARDYLRAGGAARPDGLEQARQVHCEFVRHRLSPGGAGFFGRSLRCIPSSRSDRWGSRH